MNLERLLVISIAGAIAGTLLVSTDRAGANATRQGDGVLTQDPMHLGATVPPNFIMAIDDSGSMTFQTMFPGQDGEACWSDSADSFFNSNGTLRTSGSCNYFYVLPGPRNGNSYLGIPPLDTLGFARSPDFNPSYFDPYETYQPWIGDDLASYGNASVSGTKIDPRDNDTVDLFSDRYTTADRFTIRNGMVIPGGTSFYWGNQNYRFNNDYTWNSGSGTIYINYRPGEFFLRYSGNNDPLPPGYSSGDRVRVRDACGDDCDMWRYRPSTAAAKQNFANWFSYYGNRNKAMVAGLTRSLADVTNMRVGYFTINGNYGNVDMREMDDSDQKSDLYEDILDLGYSGSTPNRKAVAHLGAQFDKNKRVIQHACQKNAGMLFTDGYSNQGGPGNYHNSDGDMGAPFADNHSNTLADIAAYYYQTRLRDKDFSSGRVPLSDPAVCESGTAAEKRAADCNADLHMNFYGVTLGAKGKLFGVSYGVNPDGTTSGALATEQVLSSGTTPAWQARQDDDPSTVDEIWHATMNARGAYINATTPAAITNAMRDVLASVGVGGGVSGSLAITGARLGDGSLSVEPTFDRNGTDWYGDVIASVPSRNSSGVIQYSREWAASEELPAAGSRRILYAVTTTDSTPAVADFYDDGPSDLDALCSNYDGESCGPMSSTELEDLGITATQAIRYLAGDRSLEGTKLRTRTHPIGDIVNSTPVVSAPTDDYGHALIRPSDGSFEYDPYGYNDYLDDKADRPRIVYVGANDGMLHAFNGEGGEEEFGYIPAAVLGSMGNLLFPKSPDFQHRYYVDGPVVVSDALFGNNDWRTVLVGTTGAGARSVFGLDVSDVGDGTLATGDVLWEVNDQIPGDVGDRIGHVLGKPVIVPVQGSSGRPSWKAIFGGGYANRLNEADADTRGTATLFIVDMESGAVDYIDAREDDDALRANGMGNIVAIDRLQYSEGTGGYVAGSDGLVDTIYSADLQGNIWKFDLTADGNDRLALDGEPLFTATGPDGTRQPVTGGLEATLGPRGGVMVLFGTGSFSYVGDKQNTDVQSVYAVLDMPGESVDLPLSRANLQVQRLAAPVAGGGSPVTATNVNYFGQRGWYIDLARSGGGGDPQENGERMVGYPRLEGGTLFFPTYAPDEGDACSGGGSNFLYGLGALSGAPQLGTMRVGKPDGSTHGETTGRIELDTSGSAPIKDVNVFTTGKQGALAGAPDDDAIDDYDSLPAQYCMAIVSVAGADPMYRVRQCGRQSWRQIR